PRRKVYRVWRVYRVYRVQNFSEATSLLDSIDSADLYQGDLEHLPDRIHELEFDLLEQLFGYLFEVTAILLRQDDGVDAGAARGQHLFFNAADRKHVAAQGDLDRHSSRALEGAPSNRRHHRRRT